MSSKEVVRLGISLICDHFIKDLTKHKQKIVDGGGCDHEKNIFLLVASNTLLRELADEDPELYYNHLTINFSFIQSGSELCRMPISNIVRSVV